MKKSSLLKLVVVIALSLLLVVNLASVVFADDATFGWDDPTITNEAAANTSATNTSTNTTNTATTNTSTNTTNTTTTNITTNTSNTSISTGNAITTLNTTSTNESENEVNSLAYTGIENNSFLVVVILVGAMIAGYSLKKVKEYNNI